MTGKIALAFAALALAGCAGPRPAAPVDHHDLGPIGTGPNSRIVAALRGVEVFAPSWLDSPALQYRLAYLGSQQRRSYGESRWVAPPAELLAHALNKNLFSGDAAGACKLRVDLDEFVQVFDAAEASRAVVEARVQLLAPGGEPLARHALRVSRPAASGDAKGGVAAFSATVADLAAALRGWLGTLDREGKPGLNIFERCRGGA